MTSYLATIRIEAFGLAEAKEEAAWIADHSRGEEPAEIVSVKQETPQLLPNHDFESGGSWTATSPYVTATDIEGDRLSFKRSWWQRLRKWWKR